MGWLPGSADLSHESSFICSWSAVGKPRSFAISAGFSHMSGASAGCLSFVPWVSSSSRLAWAWFHSKNKRVGTNAKMHHQSSLTFAAIPSAKTNHMTWTQSEEMGQNSHHHHHPSSQHAQNKEVVQRYTAKGLGPERGKNWAHVSISCSHIRKNLPTLIAGKERE